MGGIRRFFKLDDLGTNIRTEVRAGIVTFIAMSYIIFVNPIILQNGWRDKPYAASTEYEQALHLLKPLEAKPAFYLEARDSAKDMAKRIQDSYEELANAVRQLQARNDIEDMLIAMQDILTLIPDDNDPRRQRTRYYMALLLKQEEARRR